MNRVLARCQNRAAVHVLFRTLNNSSETTGTRNAAAGLPGVQIHQDAEGTEARRFGAETSGHTVLYDPNGWLLFRGGITAGRGHEGDNIGGDSIVALVTGAAAAAQHTPVYGCRLFSECEELCAK